MLLQLYLICLYQVHLHLYQYNFAKHIEQILFDYSLENLFNDLLKKKILNKEISYTSNLLSNKNLLARKIGEESIEVILEYLNNNKENIIKESADLLYHLSVLWISVDVKPDDVWNEFQNRRGKSGLDEKKSRSS